MRWRASRQRKAVALGMTIISVVTVASAISHLTSLPPLTFVLSLLTVGLTSGLIGWSLATREGANLPDAPLSAERKRIEEAIYRGKKEWEATVDAVSDLIILTDAEGKIIRCNRSTIQRFQTTYGDLIGRSIQDVFGLGVEPSLWMGEMQFPRLAGWFEVSSYPVHLENCLLGVGYVMKDVTERRQTEEELRRYRLHLETLVEERTAELTRANLQLQQEIAERRRAEQALQHRLQLEKTVSTISARFVGVSDIDEAIDASLADMGRLSGASRAYLFLFRDHAAVMDNTHEWCAEGVSPQIDNLQDLPTAMFPWWMSKLQAGEIIHIADVSKMPPEAEAEKRILESQDIKSLLVLPVYVKGELAGFTGFDNVTGTGEWSRDDLTLLQLFCGILGSALERKQAETALWNAHIQNEQLLASISAILIGVDGGGVITHWNRVAEETFGVKMVDALGKPLKECGVEFNREPVMRALVECQGSGRAVRVGEVKYRRADGKEGVLILTVSPFAGGMEQGMGCLLVGEDITDRMILEEQLRQAQKLESIGRLAAGIAHEINTPTQYVGDNTRFLQESFVELRRVLKAHQLLLKAAREGSLTPELIAEVERTGEEANLEYLLAEIPEAIRQSLEGIERVAGIVRAMKEFSHPGVEGKTAVDINRALESTITVARNEWKYVAEVETDFAEDLPLVPCLPGEINQVMLNILVNAAQAIGEVMGRDSNREKGKIRVSTRRLGQEVEIRISDTGPGIPEEIRGKVFDPFFTTKEVGKGMGQGLAIAHHVVVEKHKGTITFETEVGKGTTFIIRLPVDSERVSEKS